jgi:excisionase family DNA binding protein
MADRLGINIDTLSRLRKAGRIRGYRLQRKYRYDPDEVRAQLARK